MKRLILSNEVEYMDTISQIEMEKIENTEVDHQILDNIKEQNDGLFFKTQVKKGLEKVKGSLDEDEEIQCYFVGRNYYVDSARLGLAVSIIGAEAANPIFKWNTVCVLVGTNKRNIIMELSMGGQYDNHYEISESVQIVKKNSEFYIITTGRNDEEVIIQFNLKLYDAVLVCLTSKNYVSESNRKIRSKALEIGIGTGRAFLIFAIIMTIITVLLEWNLR